MKILQNNIAILGLLFTGLVPHSHCTAQTVKISVQNKLDFQRTEVTSIKREKLSRLLSKHPEKDIRIKKQGSSIYSTTQWIDYNQDGISDELLFLADVKPNDISNYEIVIDNTPIPETPISTFSRFVPERTDDYTWENDKVAFRVYGPKGQQEALQGIAGSTLSSGVDLWLKRVTYPIINKWYQKHLESPGYYHTDHGEGYDPYHVGNSRGTGGIGIWVNDSLQVSQNYTTYKTIATGPLRTVFELTYEPWSDYGIQQTSTLSLDLGSNFTRFDISLTASKKAPNYTIGISLHQNKGETKINTTKGWFRHWETIDDSFIGEGIVTDPSSVTTAFANNSKTPDQSNLLVITKPSKKLVYYAGFAWQKSGQISSKEDWDKMLERESLIVRSPMKIK